MQFIIIIINLKPYSLRVQQVCGRGQEEEEEEGGGGVKRSVATISILFIFVLYAGHLIFLRMIAMDEFYEQPLPISSYILSATNEIRLFSRTLV